MDLERLGGLDFIFFVNLSFFKFINIELLKVLVYYLEYFFFWKI